MYKNFQEAYYGMLNKVVNEGKEVTVRGLDMLELIPGYFEIENPRDRVLNIDCRNKSVRRYLFGELLWYLTGNNRCDFIGKYSKMWPALSDDGEHNNSAYGQFIFNELPTVGYGITNNNFENKEVEFKSQWEFVKEVLTKDPCSRQAVIHIKPIQMYATKDTVCTFFLHFFIRDGKLDMIACMRSNDLMFGTTYDVFMFTFLQELMAAELGIEVGTYKHFASNIHIYKKDMEKINAILSEDVNKETLPMHKIEKDFRTTDLPILLEAERQYWESDSHEIEGILEASLSDVGKDLLKLLTNNYED